MPQAFTARLVKAPSIDGKRQGCGDHFGNFV
jgi:hypothetical protein